MLRALVLSSTALCSATALAAELHVSRSGTAAGDGSRPKPFASISAAAQKAMPGDTVTVHTGVYREWVKPPRGGDSNIKRIVYQAAPGEKVVITGSEIAKGWTRVQGDTWKVEMPNKRFGAFNPFAEEIHGDWYTPHLRAHRGGVCLGENWLVECGGLAEVLAPVAGGTPRWFAQVDGIAAPVPPHLLNVATVTLGGNTVEAASASAKEGTQVAVDADGVSCVGWIQPGNWLRFDGVNFGTKTDSINLRAAAPAGAGGDVEIRLDSPQGELVGVCVVESTGDFRKWKDFTAKLKPVSGRHSLHLIFKPHTADTGRDMTVVYAQFPGVDPNGADAEIFMRPTVFTPEKTGVNYITLRGFTLENAATNWAAPTAGQIGLVSAYWCKGWIIEDNEIRHSRCSGIALGKYSDEWDGKRGTTEGYYNTVEDAWKKGGWSKANIGSHIVRRNRIHHCEQTGIVGSLGCAFSIIEGNEIHDIHVQGLFTGAEMAGIKFHGPVDVVIRDNHIYRIGPAPGIWLDWMAQGTQVTGNLMHDNANLFCEVDHGPFLVANNLFLSASAHDSCSQGGAYAHNLITGVVSAGADTCAGGRKTPYLKPHSTDIASLYAPNPLGDARWYNNIFAGGTGIACFDASTWPVAAQGNVYTNSAKPTKFEASPFTTKSDFNPAVKLVQKADGWYFAFSADKAWKAAAKRPLVTTALLGKAKIPEQVFDNPNGSPLRLDTDYFGKKRDASNPFPGPFETPVDGEIKVWPK